MRTCFLLALFLTIAASLPAQEEVPPLPPPSKAAAWHSVDVTDGDCRSYCVHRDGALEFVFLSKHAFTAVQDTKATDGRLDFDKAKLAKAHSIAFSLAKDTLVVSLEGNLVFHYDLVRSRVFVIDFDHHGFSPIVRQIPVELKPIATPEILTEESTRVFQWLAKVSEADKWEYTREKVPEKEYQVGKAVDPDDQSIIWGEPNEVGLRLGIGGLTRDARIPVGKKLPVKQYIRNDGPDALHLSPTGFFNEGIEADLISETGAQILMKRGYKWPMFFIRIVLGPGQFAELQSSPLSTILANADGSPSTKLGAYASGFVVSPGNYTLHLSHHIGKFIGKPVNANLGDPRLAPGLGEWTGTLQAAPIPVQLVDPTVAIATPGVAVELERLHRIQFKKSKLVLSHRASGLTGSNTWAVDEHGNWPTPGGTWTTSDPTEDYVAAWDEGGTRLWYVDSTGIQRLDIEKEFQDAGFWPLEEAGGDLADMPDGVREALDLPARNRTAP